MVSVQLVHLDSEPPGVRDYLASIIVPFFRTKTKVPRDGVNCPRSHSKDTVEQDWTQLLLILKMSSFPPPHTQKVFLAKSL